MTKDMEAFLDAIRDMAEEGIITSPYDVVALVEA